MNDLTEAERWIEDYRALEASREVEKLRRSYYIALFLAILEAVVLIVVTLINT
jgi:hypothetical protein